DPTWSGIAQYPSAIMDNTADQIDGLIYSVGGFNGAAIIPTGYVYDPATDSWSPIAAMPVAREKPGAGAIGGKLYVSGGWDTSGNPLANTGAYDPAADAWQTVAPNPAPRAAPGSAVADDKLYLVGGCANSACTPSNNTMRYDPAADTWETLAPYPHAISWESCAGIDGKVYCAGGFAAGTSYTDGFVYDPASNTWSPIAAMPVNLWGSAYAAANGMLLISSGLTGPSTLTNQGFAYDPSSDSWSALPNAQLPRFRGGGACGFYKLGGSSIAGFSPTPDSEHLSELDQCGVTDVPWLAEDPTTGTLDPGESTTVTVTFSATTEAEVTQPGAYTAQIAVSSNTPVRVDPIDVTMDVTPPKDWGKVQGTVTGVDCEGNSAPLQGVQVRAEGNPFTFSTSTDAEGAYAYWGPDKSNPYM
ncbi:MAG: kelch repeat-containing protein, partial [Micromonosporaceae bacterium]